MRGKNSKVVGDYKHCRLCDKMIHKDYFYKRSYGGLYAYCIPCDKKRAVARQRQIKEMKKAGIRNRLIEIEKMNLRCRNLLIDSLEILSDKFPDLELTDEIRSFLKIDSVVKKLCSNPK